MSFFAAATTFNIWAVHMGAVKLLCHSAGSLALMFSVFLFPASECEVFSFINTFDPMMGSMILILGDVPIPLFLRLESSTKPCPITVLARNHIHAVPNHVAFTLSRKFAKKNPIPSEDLSTPPVRTSTSALHFFLSVLVSLSVQVLCPAALERCAGIRPLLKLEVDFCSSLPFQANKQRPLLHWLATDDDDELDAASFTAKN